MTPWIWVSVLSVHLYRREAKRDETMRVTAPGAASYLPAATRGAAPISD